MAVGSMATERANSRRLIDVAEKGNGEPVLSLHEVAVTYGAGEGRSTILQGVDLRVREGEFLTVMGSSGAGKSTLLNAVAQTVPISRGRIDFKGVTMALPGLPPSPGCDRKIGYVTQDDNLLPWRTIWQNLLFPLSLRGKPTVAQEAGARLLLERVGLSKWSSYYPHQLSGGMRKRASLARTLIYGPEVILMDEPFGALDAETRSQLQADLLMLWRSERKTILFVTHDINEAITLGTRAIVLSGSPGSVMLDRPIDIGLDRDPETIFKAPGFSSYYDAIRACLRPRSHA